MSEPLSEALLNFYTFPPVAVIFSLLEEKREGHLEELYSSSCTQKSTIGIEVEYLLHFSR